MNLLLPKDFDELSLDPELLIARAKALKPKQEWIVIDEVQKLPRLLDIVHHLIESEGIKFALTGSSARRLRRKGVNLLAGRASVYDLFPLTHRELGEEFSLHDALEWGTLPAVAVSTNTGDKREFLQAYTHSYLKEEIAEEQAVRKLEPFRKFLAVAAQSHTRILNFKSIANDVGTSPVSVKTYFEILQDTLLGFFLEPFHESVRKSQRQSPKFYIFDAGVERALGRNLDVPLKESSYAYGAAFEAFVINEAYRLNSYLRCHFGLSYLRTKNDVEIDLVVERSPKDRVLIEIKSTTRVHESDCTSLSTLSSDIRNSEAYLLSRDPTPKRFGKVHALPWNVGLKEIFG